MLYRLNKFHYFCTIQFRKKRTQNATMSNHVTHDGVITKIEGRQVTVQFVQQSACAGCHAKALCSSGDAKQRSIVADSFGLHYDLGEQVTIEVTTQLARTAVLLAFALPTALALLVLFPTNLWLGEMAACAVTLGAVAAYYIVLYQFRERLARKVVFILHRKNN